MRRGNGERSLSLRPWAGLSIAFAAIALVALPSLASAAPRPALHYDDRLDWGFAEAADLSFPDDGDTLATTVRVGNGVPGAVGYDRKTTDPKQTPSGISTSLLGAVQQGPDDGAAEVELPFSFPFHGVRYRNVSVSTNGWVSFGAPAFDYYPDNQQGDYRGTRGIVGSFYRGLMPYWTDLDLDDCGGGAGALDQVVPKDESAVAFVWNIDHHCSGPRRIFEVVLFRDGRIRFDYFGANTASSQDTIVGISGGTGRSSFDDFALDTNVMPSNSILWKPEGASASASDKTKASVTLPTGSTFASADSSDACSVDNAPTAGHAGLALCRIPALDPGDSVSRTVAFVIPSAAPFELPDTAPNLDLLASVNLGPSLNDREESALHDSGLGAGEMVVDPFYTSPPTPAVGDNLVFEVALTPNVALHRPQLGFEWPAGTRFVSSSLPSCPAPDVRAGPGAMTCALPSGFSSYPGTFTVKATSGGTKTVTFVGNARNTPREEAQVSSPAVSN